MAPRFSPSSLSSLSLLSLRRLVERGLCDSPSNPPAALSLAFFRFVSKGELESSKPEKAISTLGEKQASSAAMMQAVQVFSERERDRGESPVSAVGGEGGFPNNKRLERLGAERATSVRCRSPQPLPRIPTTHEASERDASDLEERSARAASESERERIRILRART